MGLCSIRDNSGKECQNMGYKKICHLVLQSNNNITSATLLDDMGRIEDSVIRDGILKDLHNAKRKTLFAEYALRHKTRKEFDEEFGNVRCTCTQRENGTLLSFPLDNYLLILTCLPYVDPYHISKKILRMISGSIKTVPHNSFQA